MRVVIFGASGMVGQGALQECLRDPGVRRVVSVVRAATGKQHEKLHEIVRVVAAAPNSLQLVAWRNAPTRQIRLRSNK
jgi:hypothetical protein